MDGGGLLPEARARAAALLDEAQRVLDTASARNSPAGADLATGRARIALVAGDVAQSLAAAKRARRPCAAAVDLIRVGRLRRRIRRRLIAEQLEHHGPKPLVRR